MGEAEIVIEEQVTEYQLLLPDGKVYLNCSDWQEYIKEYVAMLNNIEDSPKLSDEQKLEKRKTWEAGNADAIKRMDAVTKTKFIAAKQGVDPFADLEDPLE
jgi:tRNA G46 methylase TrmB